MIKFQDDSLNQEMSNAIQVQLKKKYLNKIETGNFKLIVLNLKVEGGGASLSNT